MARYIIYIIAYIVDVNGFHDYDDDGEEDRTNVMEVQWSGIIWNKHSRKLINQSHGNMMMIK